MRLTRQRKDLQKNTFIKNAALAIIMSMSSLPVTADITGVVLDKTSKEPLIGASIQIDGTSIGTITDIDGNFSLPCSDGTYNVVIRYLGYETLMLDKIRLTDKNKYDFELAEASTALNEMVVVGRTNRTSEAMLLMNRRTQLIATEAIGAKELSRKGASDAESAVAKMAGIAGSGEKNVNIRGLGDRYNATFYNGFLIPSEDAEYKNISLSYFPSNAVSNIAVKKTFSASDETDLSGAGIDIVSRKLTDKYEGEIGMSAGSNSIVVNGKTFIPTGSNSFGIANIKMPESNGSDRWIFGNSLNPLRVNAPVERSLGLSGGKQFVFGEKSDRIGVFALASYDAGYSLKHEVSRNTTTNGTITKEMNGTKSSADTRHLIMLDFDYTRRERLTLTYNFMLLHTNRSYYGIYRGYGNDYNFGDGGEGMLIRQQVNDNTLQIHQLHADIDLAPRWSLNIAANYNRVSGNEPDRRINTLTNDCGTSDSDDWRYEKGDGAQQRYFSALRDDNTSVRAFASYNIPSRRKGSKLSFGYKGRYDLNHFNAILYNTNILYSKPKADPDNIDLDAVFSAQGLKDEVFRISANTDRYKVNKQIHKGFAELDYIFSKRWSGNLGIAADYIDVVLYYSLNNNGKRGTSKINKFYFLPALNVRYNASERHSLRLGASKTYTLPQAKELSPFRYYDVNFASEGNKDLVPSDCYNVDLRWEWYIGGTELVSATVFYKHITNPISRVDQANAASVLTYKNVAPNANIAGVEVEVRKAIFNIGNAEQRAYRLMIGANASYIYSHCKIDLPGSTDLTGNQLEGAAPWIVNADLTYNYISARHEFMAAVVFNYVSDRIYVTGMQGYADTKQSADYRLDFVANATLANHWKIGVKVHNLINSLHSLYRSNGNNATTLSSYRNGIDFSLSLAYTL